MEMRKVVQTAGALALALGMHSAALAAEVVYVDQRGGRVQAEISGNRMILIGLNKERRTAPDGVYKSLDGKSIVVQGGIIVQGGAAAPGAMQHKMAPAHKSPGSGELLPAIVPRESQAIKGASTQSGVKATPPAAAGMSDLKK